jgi:glyoxylase-like metal-dependent hydrolase (beta-lactamase superfamily II)
MKVRMQELIIEQMSRIGVAANKISIVWISHSHPDHTGPAANFPQARLLMGKADFALLVQTKSGSSSNTRFDGSDSQGSR